MVNKKQNDLNAKNYFISLNKKEATVFKCNIAVYVVFCERRINPNMIRLLDLLLPQEILIQNEYAGAYSALL